MTINKDELLDNAFFFKNMQMYQQAIDKCNSVLDQYTDCYEAFLLRGEINLELGRFDKSIIDIRKSININGNDTYAHFILAHAYKKNNDPVQALECYKLILDLDKRNAEAIKGYVNLCKNYGNSLLAASMFDKAEDYFNRALEYSENDPVILYRLVLVLWGKGKIQESIALAEKVIRISPEHVRAKAHIASAYELLGELEKGMLIIEALYRDHPEHPMVSIVYASYALRKKKQHNGISALQTIINNKATQEYDLITALMFLGKLYDSIEEYDSAFDYYSQANNILASQAENYNPQVFSDYISTLISYFSKEKYASITDSTNTSDELIFIVGMPRSGTSLIEQILSTHSSVFGAGELNYINQLVDNICREVASVWVYPACLDGIDAGTMTRLADNLISNVRTENYHSLKITDKMPNNFIHLGLIHKLLPNAKIIHCTRDARDTCLSCYFQYFAGSHPYANNLHTLGAYYHDYQRLMEHWENELKIPVLTVRYEDIVADTRQQIKKMIEFAGLPWEEKCMEFYKHKRTVATSSYNQVNKKIYTNSISRWKNYASYIEALVSALKE